MTIDEFAAYYGCPSRDDCINELSFLHNCLNQTDYVVVKSMELGEPLPNGFSSCREEIRERIRELGDK